MGLPKASTRARIFVVSPPRERPRAWSSPPFYEPRHHADERNHGDGEDHEQCGVRERNFRVLDPSHGNDRSDEELPHGTGHDRVSRGGPKILFELAKYKRPEAPAGPLVGLGSK